MAETIESIEVARLKMAEELVTQHLNRIQADGAGWKVFETKEGLIEVADLIYSVKNVLVNGK